MLRACYSSTWRLYPDNPEIEVPGRYYFAEPGTPFFRGDHAYGSARWMRPYFDAAVKVGEIPGTPQSWSDGVSPGAAPLAIVLGSTTCCAGAVYPPTLDPVRQFRYGLDVRCYAGSTAAAPTTFGDWSIDDPSLLLVEAQVLDWLYSDPSKIPPFVTTWLGSAATTTLFPSVGLQPGFAVITMPTYNLVIIGGTSNFQQLSTQLVSGTSSPTDFGYYSTMPLWQATAQQVQLAISSTGANPNVPTMFVGHSYGGAVATILAVQYGVFKPSRPVRLTTFGMPKPGDQRLVDLASQVPSLHVVNDNDPVPLFPPDRASLAYLTGILPGLLVSQWASFVPAKPQFTLNSAGALLAGAPSLLWSTTLAVVTNNLLDQPQVPWAGHLMSEYLRRLNLLAPTVPVFPVNEDARKALVPALDQTWRGKSGTSLGASANFLP